MGTGAGKFQLGKDMAFDLFKGGNSSDESGPDPSDDDSVVEVEGTLTSLADVDVDQSEGAENEEVAPGKEATFEDGKDGNDWNFFNLALCLCLKDSRKWSPGGGFKNLGLELDLFTGLSTRLLSRL